MSGDRVIVIGDVMTDVIVVPEGPIVYGSDRRATIRSRPGGSGANQAVWLGALGEPAGLIARVGADELRTYEAYFRGLNVAPLLEGDRERQTGALVTIVDPNGERSFLTDRGANLALGAEGLADALLDEAGMLLVSGYALFSERPRAAVRDLIGRARSAGIEVAVDPASAGFLSEVGPANFLDWVEGASLIFANRDEAMMLTDCIEVGEQLDRLGERFQSVALKLGAGGAALRENGVTLTMPARDVPVVDTSGAGDAFAAGYLAARRAGGSMEQRLERAIRLGSIAVGFIGAQPDSETFDRLSREASAVAA